MDDLGPPSALPQYLAQCAHRALHNVELAAAASPGEHGRRRCTMPSKAAGNHKAAWWPASRTNRRLGSAAAVYRHRGSARRMPYMFAHVSAGGGDPRFHVAGFVHGAIAPPLEDGCSHSFRGGLPTHISPPTASDRLGGRVVRVQCKSTPYKSTSVTNLPHRPIT